MLIHTERYFTAANIDEYIDSIGDLQICRDRKKMEYFNAAAGFDIETSSFKKKEQKIGIVYAFMVCIEGWAILLRNWDEFFNLYYALVLRYQPILNKKHLIIYIHNEAFEFAFACKRFNIADTFAVDDRKPIYFITAEGVEFRCSYMESALSLEKVGESLKTYAIRKAVGQLDYSLIRHSKTPLTSLEIEYCLNDVYVLCAYIREKIKEYKFIYNIKLTNTGYVRDFVRKKCMKNKGYFNLMRRLRIRDTKELLQLKRAFSGGFTHGNALNVGKVFKNVFSMDLCSAYPSVLVYCAFPMSQSRDVNIVSKKQLWYMLYNYCCMFDVEFIGLESKDNVADHYISSSKCVILEGNKENDNGRVVAADRIRLTVTDVDFKIIDKHYKYDEMRVENFKAYKRGYLPKEIVEAVLELYKNKTTLKGVDEELDLYMKSKGMLNSCYGMAVTDIVRDIIEWTGTEWKKEDANIEECLTKYNDSKSRFLYYPWGVWITAYTREIIWSAIDELGPDYIYSDTDSVKGLNYEKHKAYFDKFNEYVVRRLKTALNAQGIEYEGNANPRTVKGKEKVLGVFELDGYYTRFKTLGAKRYIYEYIEDEEHIINITVSGVNKKTAMPWLMKTFKDPFEAFKEGLEIPPEACGKLTHTYIDYEVKGTITDYTGIVSEYHELSGVYMEPVGYKLTIDDNYEEYLDYLSGNLENVMR